MRRVLRLSAVAIMATLMQGMHSASASIITSTWTTWSTNTSDLTLGTPASTLTPDGSDYDTTIVSNQSALGGGIGAAADTDSPGDPTLNIENSVNNDTTFAWMSYMVAVQMSNPFTLANISSVTPATWTFTASPVFSPTVGLYEEDLLFGGTPSINIGGTFDFKYQLTFAATNSSFAFNQILTPIPVPEPTSFGLLTAGGLGILARRRKRAIEATTR